MKNIISLLLLAFVFTGINNVAAKTKNNREIKGVSSTNVKNVKNEKKDTKVEADKIKKNAPGEDTTSKDPDFHFYTPKYKRGINIQDVYVGIGGGCTVGKGGVNAPYNTGVALNTTYGIPLYNKYFLLEISNNAEFMFAPNKDWFAKAFGVQKSDLRGVGAGFTDELTMGLHVVIAGSRKLSLTAGPMAGGKLTNLPSMKLDGMMYYVSAPISFCYGLKTNLYIGDHFYCYAQYSNSTTTNMVSYTSQIVTDYSQTVRHIPVDMGTIRVGAVLVLEPWW